MREFGALSLMVCLSTLGLLGDLSLHWCRIGVMHPLVDKALEAEAARFQGTISNTSSLVGCRASSTSLLLGSDWDGRRFEGLICWRDLEKHVSEPFIGEEEVRGGLLKMILKDGSKVDFLVSGMNLDVDAKEGEEARPMQVNGLTLEG